MATTWYAAHGVGQSAMHSATGGESKPGEHQQAHGSRVHKLMHLTINRRTANSERPRWLKKHEKVFAHAAQAGKGDTPKTEWPTALAPKSDCPRRVYQRMRCTSVTPSLKGSMTWWTRGSSSSAWLSTCAPRPLVLNAWPESSSPLYMVLSTTRRPPTRSKFRSKSLS